MPASLRRCPLSALVWSGLRACSYPLHELLFVGLLEAMPQPFIDMQGGAISALRLPDSLLGFGRAAPVPDCSPDPCSYFLNLRAEPIALRHSEHAGITDASCVLHFDRNVFLRADNPRKV